MENLEKEIIDAHCKKCGCQWLGAFWNVPLCNQCRYQELGAFEPIGGEDDVLGVGDAPEEDEKESLPLPEDDEIDSMVESESKEYVNAH